MSMPLLKELKIDVANKVNKTCKTITDWNTATETGFVQTGTGIVNGPAGVDYAGGFVLKRGTHILQYAIASRTGVMYTRSSLDGTTWQEWKATSQNITTGTEYETGRIINGKKEYAKLIGLGELPNTSTKSVAHGIPNLTSKCSIIKIEGFAQGENATCFPLPYASPSGLTSSVAIMITDTNVTVITGNDRSALTGRVTIYYTKNS